MREKSGLVDIFKALARVLGLGLLISIIVFIGYLNSDKHGDNNKAVAAETTGNTCRDDFDSFDPNNWSKEEHEGPSCTLMVEENVSAVNGKLEITVSPLDPSEGGMKAEGGEILSKSLHQYGSYRAGMQAADANHVISSFFTFWREAECKDPNSTYTNHEIDVEIIKCKGVWQVYFVTWTQANDEHPSYSKKNAHLILPESELGFDPSAGLHEYGFDWHKDKVIFYIDGNSIWTSTEHIPDKPSYIAANAWNSCDWCNPTGDAPEQATKYYIDYIESTCPVQRGPIPGLDAETPYCFFYGKLDDCVIEELKKFKLVILHPGMDEPWATPAQVASLKAAGVIVIGYASVGEDYDPNRVGDGRGPCYFDDQNCTIVYENNGYASWLLDEVDINEKPGHDGLPDKNPNFGSAPVNAGDPNWSEFVYSATINGDKFAGTKYILNDLGCNGLFLDVIETASPWGKYFWTWRGMFNLIYELSDLYPEKYLVANRPLFSCYPAYYPLTCCNDDPCRCSKFCFCDFSSQEQARDKFREHINALVWESYSLDKGDDTTKSKVMECADNADGKGFNVLILDYHTLIHNLYPSMDDQIKEVTGLGWLDFIAYGRLDQTAYWVYNYLNNITSILIDGNFNEWKHWNVSFCSTDPAGDSNHPAVDIIGMSLTHDAEYLYVKIQCQGIIPSNFSPNFYRIYLDSNAISLGYKGSTGNWEGEYGFLVENGKLWKYTGTGSDWSWKFVKDTPYAIGMEDGTGSMEIAIPRCAIGAEGEKTTKILLNTSGLVYEDYAPDDPSQDYYLYDYKPLILIDGNSTDWDTIPMDCWPLPPNQECWPYKDSNVYFTDCNADITNLWVASDLANLYFKVKFACDLPDPLWGNGKFYQIFIDTDQNSSTGYSQCQWKIGAEYLWENGAFYKFIGASCNDWSWEKIGDLPYSVFLADGSQIEIAIPRSSIQVSPRELSKEKSLRFILNVNTSEGSDVAPDLPEYNYYSWPNLSPSISGAPNTIVEVDANYSFTPTACDPDGDFPLTFSIENKPSWAEFDPNTGALSGNPNNLENVGTSHDIVITVEDSKGASASLPPFDIIVTAPNISVYPTSHDFGGVKKGESSTVQIFTISNKGNADLKDLDITLSDANFSIQDDQCSGQTLEPYEDCKLAVVFSPKSEGTKNSTIFIQSNDPYTSTPDIIPVSGEGEGEGCGGCFLDCL